MKRNDKYVLKYLNDVPYLMPTGQMTASRGISVSLNSCGVYLWEQLEKETSVEDLINNTAKHYDVPENESEGMKSDIKNFILNLKNHGMLSDTTDFNMCRCSICCSQKPELLLMNSHPLNSPEWNSIGANLPKHQTIRIGGLYLDLYGMPGYYSKDFNAFTTGKYMDNGQSMRIDVLEKNDGDINFYDMEETDDKGFPLNPSYDTDTDESGVIIIHDNDLIVIEYKDEYLLYFTKLEGIDKLHLKKDGSHAVFICSESPSENTCFSIFHAVRMAFLIYALKHGLVMLHSASVLYKGYAWLFSGPSGTGKSTHTGLWNKLFDAPIINGDLNLLGIQNGKPFIYGTPWCGSSGIFNPGVYPVGGIVYLKKGNENRIFDLLGDRKILSTQNRIISSVWNADMLSESLETVENIVKDVYIKKYFCTREDSAAETIRKDIDEYLSKKMLLKKT